MPTLQHISVSASAIRGVAAVAVLLGFAQAAEAQPTMDDVLDAWRTRQASAETLHIEWTVVRTVVMGSMTTHIQSFNRLTAGTAEPAVALIPFPPVDTTLTSECQLFVKGERARYNRDGELWSFARGELPRLRDWDSTVVYDGDRRIEFTDGRRIDGAPQAVIRPGRQNFSREPWDCRPIVWCYRPLDIQRGGLHEDWLKLTGETVLIDGREHQGVFEEFSPRSGMTFWVDAERDFLVSRVTKDQSLIVDIDYEPAAEGRWALAGWTIQHLDDAVLTSHDAARIESLEVNAELSDDLFTLEFPPGTHLSEYAIGASRPAESVVGEDGR